jgi:hypothetical protein
MGNIKSKEKTLELLAPAGVPRQSSPELLAPASQSLAKIF